MNRFDDFWQGFITVSVLPRNNLIDIDSQKNVTTNSHRCYFQSTPQGWTKVANWGGGYFPSLTENSGQCTLFSVHQPCERWVQFIELNLGLGLQLGLGLVLGFWLVISVYGGCYEHDRRVMSDVGTTDITVVW